MKEKILRKTRFPILEFVFRCTEDRVWLSLESVKDDSLFMDIASLCLRTAEFNNICDEVCEKINSIYNIKSNKQKLINMIKLLGSEEKKLSILTLNVVSASYFDYEGCSFYESVYSEYSLSSSLRFMEDEMQYSKMHHFFISSNSDIDIELRNEIFKLITTVYKLTVQYGYDIFSCFEGEYVI